MCKRIPETKLKLLLLVQTFKFLSNIYINLHCIFVCWHMYLCSAGVYGMFTSLVAVVGVS